MFSKSLVVNGRLGEPIQIQASSPSQAASSHTCETRSLLLLRVSIASPLQNNLRACLFDLRDRIDHVGHVPFRGICPIAVIKYASVSNGKDNDKAHLTYLTFCLHAYRIMTTATGCVRVLVLVLKPEVGWLNLLRKRLWLDRTFLLGHQGKQV